MGRRLLGRLLLPLVLCLGIATLAAPPPAIPQARVAPPPVLLTPVPVGTAPASQCMRRPLMRCRRVQRLVASEGTLSTRRWVWECRAAARLMLDRPRVRGCASSLPSPRCPGTLWPSVPALMAHVRCDA